LKNFSAIALRITSWRLSSTTTSISTNWESCAPHHLEALVDMMARCATSSSPWGVAGNGFPRRDGFDIVVASEVMAMLRLPKAFPMTRAA